MKKLIKHFLIDENIIVCEGIRRIINNNKEMHVVGESYSANDALQKMKSFQGDIIILDISLEGGIDLLIALRREYPKIPVLVLSKNCESANSVRLFRSGAAGCLCKTKSSIQLFEAINKVMTIGKYISEAVALHMANQVDAETRQALHTKLSNREFQIFQKLATGVDGKKLANSLYLSPKTVSTYKTRVLKKLQCNNMVELSFYALSENII